MEIKEIKGYQEKPIFINGVKSDYTVDTEGNFYSLKRNNKKPLSYNNINGGYKMCYLYVEGKRHDILVHRVVANAFIENTEFKKQVNHKDGNKQNNCVYNLEWVTQSENITHAYSKNLMSKSFKDCYNALFTEDDIRTIRTLISKGYKQRVIALQYDVSESTISNIKHGRSYKGVGLIEKGEAININTLK